MDDSEAFTSGQGLVRALTLGEASDTCARLIAGLPDWFGIPEANAGYVSGVADCHCLGMVKADGTCSGMVALRAHFGTTLEIWWMAVDPRQHRQGIGS